MWNVFQSWDFSAGIFFLQMSSTRPIISCTKTVSVPCGWEKNLRNAKPNMSYYRIAFIISELQTQQSQGSTTFLFLPEFLSHKGRKITGTPKAASSFHRMWPNHSIYRFLLQPWYYYSLWFFQFSGHELQLPFLVVFFIYKLGSVSQRPDKGGDSGAATWTFSLRTRAGKIKINLTQTTTNRNTLYI